MKSKKYIKSYRHELKYFINQGDYMLLSNALRRTMDADENADGYGEYHIRSLYFDDPFNTAFAEKLSGVDHRFKVRIRIYGLSDSVIKLERKEKDNGFISKQSIKLSRNECDMLIAGDYEFLLNRPEPFAHEMFREFATNLLKPCVIVDYVREAYTFPVEDVRITFDKDIRTAFRSTDIFNKHLPTYPALSGFDMVLEVKYNRFLPVHIRSLIQIASPIRSAASKYVYCRKYEL